MNNKLSNEFLIIQAKIVTPSQQIDKGWIRVKDGLIADIGVASPPYEIQPDLQRLETIDAHGGWLIPGFIDVHVHGGYGHDFMDAEEDGLRAITKFHATHGTTSILATTLTASREELTAVLERVSSFMAKDIPYSQVIGVHFEGPFINVKLKGAQNPAYIVPPQIEWLDDWVASYPGIIKLQTLAPESEGALEYITRLAEKGIVPSCGHTDATYEQMIAAAECGLRHAVHTYNAMRPFHHREPGTVGAVLTDDRIVTEVIADGHHVHPAGIKLLHAAKGTDNIILITDAMAAAGMPDGDYELGGLPVRMADGVARLTDAGNSLAGSTLTMIDALRYMVHTVGISLPKVSQMASLNPARQLGIDKLTGSIEVGKAADLLLLNSELALHKVWIKGTPLHA